MHLTKSIMASQLQNQGYVTLADTIVALDVNIALSGSFKNVSFVGGGANKTLRFHGDSHLYNVAINSAYRVDLSNSTLERVKLIDCHILVGIYTNFKGIIIKTKSSGSMINLEDCAVSGLDLEALSLQLTQKNCTMTESCIDAVIQNGLIRSSTLRRVTFEDCQLKQFVLTEGTKVSSCIFNECTFERFHVDTSTLESTLFKDSLISTDTTFANHTAQTFVYCIFKDTKIVRPDDPESCGWFLPNMKGSPFYSSKHNTALRKTLQKDGLEHLLDKAAEMFYDNREVSANGN